MGVKLQNATVERLIGRGAVIMVKYQMSRKVDRAACGTFEKNL